MKLTAAILTDAHTSPRGLASRALEDVAGRPLLGRLVERVRASGLFESVVLSTDKASEAALAPLAKRWKCKLHVYKGDPALHQEYLRLGRKWAPDNWRGGLCQSFVYDEEGCPRQLLEILGEEKSEGVVKISGHTPLFDARLMGDMMTEYGKGLNNMGMLFPQLTAGFCYELYTRPALERFAPSNSSVRSTLRYDPAMTQNDALNFSCVYSMQEKVLSHPFRLLADSMRGLERVRGIFASAGEACASWGLDECLEHLLKHPEILWGRLPEEVEVEITTEQNVVSRARPRPKRADQNARMSLETFARLVDGLREYDDVRLTFGGFGEPLLHPQFFDMVKMAKDAGVYGIHVHTNGLLLDAETRQKLLDAPVDIVTVGIDAATRATHGALTGTEHFDRIEENVRAYFDERLQRKIFRPFLLPEFVKSADNIDDMEEFFDKWFFGGADDCVIRGFNDHSGQVEDRNILHLNLVTRSLCDTLRKRMVVYADGAVPYCAQDFEARHAAGRIAGNPADDNASVSAAGNVADTTPQTPAELWRGPALDAQRRAQVAGDFSAGPFCAACQNWDHL